MLNPGAEGKKGPKDREVAEVGSFTPWISTELQQRATDEERGQRILHVSIISKAFWPPIQNTGPSQPLQLSCILSSYHKTYNDYAFKMSRDEPINETFLNGKTTSI